MESIKYTTFGYSNIAVQDGPWKFSAQELPVTNSEFEKETEIFEAWLSSEYKIHFFGDPGDLYLLADFQGERTHLVALKKRPLLNSKLISHIQNYLKTRNNWRVGILSKKIEMNLIIYENCMFFNNQKANSDIDAAIKLASQDGY